MTAMSNSRHWAAADQFGEPANLWTRDRGDAHSAWGWKRAWSIRYGTGPSQSATARLVGVIVFVSSNWMRSAVVGC